jgi:hypothetical protein
MRRDRRWKELSRDQKAAWRTWARNNPVLLDNGVVRRVSGEKAFTIVSANRATALEITDPGLPPSAATWLSGVLTMMDAGPFTTNDGFIGFRTGRDMMVPTRWFVWATPPVGQEVQSPLERLRFVTCLHLGVIGNDERVEINAAYAAVNGSWSGPGVQGEWPVPMHVWFRVHQYANGQLGPGQILKGWIQLEL